MSQTKTLPHAVPPPLHPTKSNPIQFVSIISRTDKPLYIQSFLPDSDSGSESGSHSLSLSPSAMNQFLKFNFFSHMALDIFTSPTSLSLREQQQQGDSADGILLLFIQDQVIVYGYESNNGLKIIVGVDQKVSVQLDALSKFIKDVYRLYLRRICNPFRNFGIETRSSIEDKEDEALNSPKFHNKVKELVENF
ncbi:hypothetical protein KGF56_000325 [Candida oxycetoniae]|uniref:Sedlin n=1 Tax=Candida oxycetoniae TaxID=497107 RepID=A0AAI9X089_9ASCO|nr:uncharacterized protein KGF56_000325 [Candida oxycetoniae]KAI3406864.2 hypothetical protein KGF56_000325 [Candida oxycetoniae]